MIVRRRFLFGAAPVLVACLGLVGHGATVTGQETLPDASSLVQRHVSALGGAPAFAAVSSIRIRGRIEIPVQKIAGDLEVLAARPNRMLYRVMVPGIGRIENGYDGSIGWSVSPVSGPELLTGRQLSEAADDAWFEAPLHAPGHVREMTTLARAEFDGKPAYKVRVVFASGNEQVEYFDVGTGLQIGSEAARATPQGVVQTVNILRDFRQCGALMHPGTFVQRALGFEQVVTLTSCEHNVVPVTAFEPPPAVRALVRR